MKKNKPRAGRFVDDALKRRYKKKNPSCEWCLYGIPKYRPDMRGLEIHHVFGGTGGRYDLWSNLMTLCSGHHDWATDNETASRIICLSIKFFKDYQDCIPSSDPADYNKQELKVVSGKNVSGYVDVMMEIKADIIPDWVVDMGTCYLQFERTWCR